MARWKLYEIEVEGRGDFPFDMLRYDRCYPAGGFDAGKMDPAALEAQRDRRSLRLRFMRQSGQALSTRDRWKSFGWIVTSESEVR